MRGFKIIDQTDEATTGQLSFLVEDGNRPDGMKNIGRFRHYNDAKAFIRMKVERMPRYEVVEDHSELPFYLYDWKKEARIARFMDEGMANLTLKALLQEEAEDETTTKSGE